MSMRSLGIIALLLAVACGDASDADSSATAVLHRAGGEFAAGHLELAKQRYAEARDSARTDVVRGRAEAGLARVRALEIEYDRALAALEALGTELGEHPSSAATSEFERIVAAPSSAEMRDKLVAEASRIRRASKDRLATLREGESAAIEVLVKKKEFAAAALLLREIESRRAPGDTEDVEAALERIAGASLATAQECLASLPAGDPEAIEQLDDRIRSLAGTPGAVSLFAERTRRMTRLAKPPPAGAKESVDPKKQP